MIEARIEADSINKTTGDRITTFVLKYPRFIHAEFMTHRVFSRNASSSRAIPLSTTIKNLREEIAYPLDFRKNKKGMQAGKKLSKEEEFKARFFWEQACENAIQAAEAINTLCPEGVHKQYINRLLEPFSHISVIVTATDYANFFGLRCHDDAQPEIHELADKMYELYKNNEPKKLKAGEWHLPFVNTLDEVHLTLDERIEKSVACCARVSYDNHDGTTPTVKQNKALYDRLLGSQPIHASPAEHQAYASNYGNVQSGNFKGWFQYRKTLLNDTINEFKA